MHLPNVVWNSDSTALSSISETRTESLKCLAHDPYSPKLSPNSCCDSSALIGSMVLYGITICIVPFLRSMPMLKSATMAVLDGRAIEANLGSFSRRSNCKVTVLTGSNALARSFSIALTNLSIIRVSMMVYGFPSLDCNCRVFLPPCSISTMAYIRSLSSKIKPRLSHSSALNTTSRRGKGIEVR